MSPGCSDPGPHEHRAQYPQPLVGPERGVGHPLGVRHEPDHVAALVAHARDVVGRAVGVLQVAQHHALLVLQPRERPGIGEKVALVVGHRQRKLLAGLTARGPRRIRGPHPHADAVAHEAHVRVAEQGAGQQMRLRQNLETVAHAQDRSPVPGELFERAHHLREAGDGARPQVVAVGEAAGNYNGVDALEVGFCVPELDRLAPRPLHAVQRVAIAVGSGEDRYSYSQETTSHSYSSMVGLERSLRHIASTSFALSTSISMSLPTWTVRTPSNPSAGSALLTASPCGSRMPSLGRTRTRIFKLSAISLQLFSARIAPGSRLAEVPLMGSALHRRFARCRKKATCNPWLKADG